MNTLKFINVRHMDYWWAVYNIGSYKQEDADGLEFCISNDEKGEKHFFHLDLYNLPCLEHMIADGIYIEKEKPDYELFKKQYYDLKSGNIDFFIGNLFYPENVRHEKGYSFLPLNECQLNKMSIFELRNRNHIMPDYGVVFINETEALIPEKVIFWIDKLSIELFKEEFKVQFIKVPDKIEAAKSYEATYFVTNGFQ